MLVLEVRAGGEARVPWNRRYHCKTPNFNPSWGGVGLWVAEPTICVRFYPYGRGSEMGRRKSGFGGSGLPVIVLGGIIWLATAVYNFILQYAVPIIAIVAIAGVAAAVAWVSRGKRRNDKFSASEELRPSRQVRSAPISWASWIPFSESIRFRDAIIPGGMIYVGDAVALPQHQYTTQYALNPELPVGRSADVSGDSMPYWPSYAEISPAARRAFVDWMRTGRSDPKYGIGHVFLFFYGLEHRQFIETNADDIDTITSEVRRLLTIYGSNDSFTRYATDFLACSDLLTSNVVVPVLEPPESYLPELSVAMRVYLGARLAGLGSLTADDALLWVMHSPDANLRTPVRRCFDEFRHLWIAHFNALFPNGFKVSKPDRNLSITYRAASGAFEVEVQGRYTAYPDVTCLHRALMPLKILVEQCTAELEAFSRFVGRNPLLRTSFEAALLLPPIIRTAEINSAAQPLQAYIQQMMAGRGTTTAPLSDLLKMLPSTSSKAGQSPFDTLCRGLDAINVAIEPDRRYGGRAPQSDSHVVIFNAKGGGPVDSNRPEYIAARKQIEIGALAAAADGQGSAQELQTIVKRIQANALISQTERLRLIAYAVTVFKNPPKPGTAFKRLSEIDLADRKAIAETAADVVKVQDRVGPKEVKFLERLNKALQLPPTDVYSRLHRRLASTDEPVPILTEVRKPGIAIKNVTAEAARTTGISPKATSTVREGAIEIDEKRLATIQRQTKEVSDLLSGIFVEDQQPVVAAKASSGGEIRGLDSSHAELVKYLASKGQVNRSEFDSRARTLKLLPDGAIERINDWSFEQFEEPLLEDGDDVVLAAHLKDQLMQLQQLGNDRGSL